MNNCKKTGIYLQENQKEVFRIWEARVRDRLSVAKSVDSLALHNSLPELYDGLIGTLVASDPQKYLDEVAKELGIQHGLERSSMSGYDLNHVVEEYQILQQVIFEVARRSGPLSEGTTDAIIDAITIGIRNATSKFVKQKSKALKESQRQAEKASLAKSSFLANMSHEIRTPLGAILGFAELLRDSESKSEREEYIQIITRNGQALSKLIHDILDLTKIEAGQLSVKHIAFALDELIDEITDLFAETANSKNISLDVEFAPHTPRRVKTDAARLRQILINIVGNAIKFTQTGSVKIKVDPVLTNDGVTGLRFTITDTGIGMTDEDARSLFKPFSQADDSSTRRFGGTGLGLALSRRLARALGGDVELKSYVKGDGCVFVITVNASVATESDHVESEKKATLKKNVRILLVEDSIDNQRFVKLLLESRGATVEVASNGKEGVQKFKEDNEYDVVLMDMQMPVLDGYAATKKLRAMGFDNPIIALTAHALPEERRRTTDIGCNAHFTKPIDTNLLVEKINDLTAQSK